MTDATATTDGTEAGDRSDDSDRADRERVLFDVPSEGPAAECAYCGRPFESELLLALHRGEAHADALTDDERADYEAAYDAESGRLSRFRLKALALLVVLYFGLLMVYAVV